MVKVKGKSGVEHEFSKLEHMAAQTNPIALFGLTRINETVTVYDVISCRAKLFDCGLLGAIQAPAYTPDALKLADEYGIAVVHYDSLLWKLERKLLYNTLSRV